MTSLIVGRAENFFFNPSVEITLYGYMDKPSKYEVSRHLTARLMVFMFHQQSAEWAQTVGTQSGNGTGVFGSFDNLLDAADE
jgi:hypothetical protein